MTALYIANPTKQTQIVCYRLDYNRKGDEERLRQFQPAKQQEIQPGRQVLLGSKDFHMSQVEDIVQQLEPFGLIASKDVGRLPRRKVNYLFNVDQPVPSDVMRQVTAHNAGVQIEEGRQRRANAAVATNDLVQQTVQEEFARLAIPAEPADSTSVAIEQLEQTELGEKRIEEAFDIVPEGKIGIHSGRPASTAKKGRRR